MPYDFITVLGAGIHYTVNQKDIKVLYRTKLGKTFLGKDFDKILDLFINKIEAT